MLVDVTLIYIMLQGRLSAVVRLTSNINVDTHVLI